MDFEETLQMVENACVNVCGLNCIDHNEIFRTATQIYLADLPKKNMVEGLKKAKERMGDLTYYNACDDGSVDLDNVFEILDELIESVEV